MKKLSEIIKNKSYIIHSVTGEDISLTSKLNQVGFIEGEKVVFLRNAPLFKDPILFRVGESQIALTKSEANCVTVIEDENV